MASLTGTSSVRLMLLGAFVLGGIAVLYRDVVRELVVVWSTDTNYSHGFLIPPIAAFLAWERRERFLAAPSRPALAGLVVIGGSVLVLALGGGRFLTRISLVAAHWKSRKNAAAFERRFLSWYWGSPSVRR